MSQVTENKQENLEEASLLIGKLQAELKEKNQLIHSLYEQLKLSRHRQFGKKSEKQSADDPQAQLFDEAQTPLDTQAGYVTFRCALI